MTDLHSPQLPAKKSAAKRWLWLLLACALIVALLAVLKYLQISKAIAFAESFPERSETVTAIKLEPVIWNRRYQTIGEVKSAQFVDLRTEIDGVITELGFAGGDAVQAGQLLLQLDNKEERSQLQALQAQFDLAELQLERVTELRAKKLASKNDYDRALADKNVLAANVAALEAVIAKKSLHAPFSAQTSLHNLQIGQYLASNAVVTELSGDGREFWVEFNLPQDKAGLAVGDEVQLSGRGLIEGSVAAQIISASASFNPQSRSREYRALLSAAPSAIRPGAVLNVDLIVETLDGVFKLPATAVRRNNFGAHVYVLVNAEDGSDAKYRGERRSVTVGESEGADVVVTGGIQQGELIAAIGAFKLVDGILVNVVERLSEPAALPKDTTSTSPTPNND